jgi:uncharacterized protein (TIGR03437 family)
VALNNGSIISLTVSGFTVLSSNFDATTAKPIITNVVNTSDPAQKLTGGGLISVLGTNLSTSSASSSAAPAPTVLADSCVTVNGALIPLFLVSPTRINAQLPLTAASGVLVVHTPGGESDPFNLSVQPTAPSIITRPLPGPASGNVCGADIDCDIFRVLNEKGDLLRVTLTNPVHKGDRLVILTSGLGPTSPPVEAGLPAPSNPPALVVNKPVVELDGATCPVTFAGLVGGQIGVYRIDVDVPQGIQQGLFIPLTISQGSNSSTVLVRVVQ